MKKITFTLPVEALGSATEALLLGDFNNWDPSNAVALVEVDGVLTTSVDLEPGKTYEYKYYLNNGSWVNSWNAESYAFNSDLNIENSLITVPLELVVTETVIIAEPKKVAVKKTAAKKAIEKPVAEPQVEAKKVAAPKKAAAKKAVAPKKAAAKTTKK